VPLVSPWFISSLAAAFLEPSSSLSWQKCLVNEPDATLQRPFTNDDLLETVKSILPTDNGIYRNTHRGGGLLKRHGGRKLMPIKSPSSSVKISDT
jgi:hypothetical protein